MRWEPSLTKIFESLLHPQKTNQISKGHHLTSLLKNPSIFMNISKTRVRKLLVVQNKAWVIPLIGKTCGASTQHFTTHEDSCFSTSLFDKSLPHTTGPHSGWSPDQLILCIKNVCVVCAAAPPPRRHKATPRCLTQEARRRRC